VNDRNSVKEKNTAGDRHRLWNCSTIGLLFGSFFFALSLTPSRFPRTISSRA
jgi:uncharacterized membrane protein